MDASDPPDRRRVWLPARTVQACVHPAATGSDGARLAERVAVAMTAGSARSPRDTAGLLEMEELGGPENVEEWLLAYPGAAGEVGALAVLARMLTMGTRVPDVPADAGAQIRAALEAGDLAIARTAARGALVALREAHRENGPTEALVAQLTRVIAGVSDRHAGPRAQEDV